MMKGGKSPSNRMAPSKPLLRGRGVRCLRRNPFHLRETAKQTSVDTSRPSIEFYRSRNVIDLLLPVA